jgi:hypothetical protein
MKRLLIEFRCVDCGACFRTLERLADGQVEAETACVNCHRPLKAEAPGAGPQAPGQLEFPEAA